MTSGVTDRTRLPFGQWFRGYRCKHRAIRFGNKILKSIQWLGASARSFLEIGRGNSFRAARQELPRRDGAISPAGFAPGTATLRTARNAS